MASASWLLAHSCSRASFISDDLAAFRYAIALAAARRRVIGNATYPHYVRYRREEGRLHLALRVPPSPGRAQADTVRIELAKLL